MVLFFGTRYQEVEPEDVVCWTVKDKSIGSPEFYESRRKRVRAACWCQENVLLQCLGVCTLK